MINGAGDGAVKKRSGPKARPEFLAQLRGTGDGAGAGTPSEPAVPPPAPPTAAEAKPTPEPSSLQLSRRQSAPVQLESVPPPSAEELASISEVVAHCASDSIFFCRHFFPKTFRQPAAPFHPDLWSILDDPSSRYVNVVIGRDGAKTTILRSFAAKRVAFGISRTILYVGASQDKAKQSVGWLKNQVAYNRAFTRVFGLHPGKPYTNEHCVIRHGTEGHEIHVLAYGITGSVRGVNLDDWRPDLIIVDDCMNEENSATRDAREKIIGLVLGSLKESLSPASESPDAKMVLLNTPQDFEDLSQEALKDTQFKSARYGCWTPETEDLPVELQESSWPARYPSVVLRAEKVAAINRNRYSIFAREKEVKLVVPESCFFRPNWLRYYGEGEERQLPPRSEMWIEMAIDPVPPPTEMQVAKGSLKTDFEAFAVVGKHKGDFYLLESLHNRGHEPSWTMATFLSLCQKWNPKKVLVESVAYQRTLLWLLKKAMQSAARYWVVVPFEDKRKKTFRINDGLAGPGSEGKLFVSKSHTTVISQFIHYPGKNPNGTYDDDLEAFANAVSSLNQGYVGEVDDDHYMVLDKNIPELEYVRGAP